MKSFIAKRLNSILVNLRYLRFKLLKYKENNNKICNTFVHKLKNIPLYIMRKVSLERYYFVLYDCALTSKISKMALKSFCDKTLHMYCHFQGFIIINLFIIQRNSYGIYVPQQTKVYGNIFLFLQEKSHYLTQVMSGFHLAISPYLL